MRQLLLILQFLPFLLASCVTEEDYDNTPSGNFEALWSILDQHYCFFPEKAADFKLDWNEEYSYYKEMISPTMTDEQLFDVCAQLLRQLRDGHVNLSSPFNTARFWDWYEHYPANFSDSLQKLYLGTDYRISAGIKYRMLPENIGYLYCGTFDNALGSGNLHAIMQYLAIADGLIVDVRNNEGGMLTSAQALAGCFTNETITGGYIAHKTGPGHNDFSAQEPLKITPATGLRWQKPIVVLTNRRCFSAANAFVMFMRACPNVTVLGDRTGGGGGMPFSSELPNGWSLRFSACPLFDASHQSVESGLKPDVEVSQTSADFARKRDTLIEAAIQLLRQKAQTP
jgi:hypothetical protein